MRAPDAAADRDWWTAPVLIAIFCALVAAILAAVPGWAAPLHAWKVLAACILAILAVHAGTRSAMRALRRGWRDAAIALAVAAALGASAAMLMAGGRPTLATLDDAAAPAVGGGAR